jgi:hypothetical protein
MEEKKRLGLSASGLCLALSRRCSALSASLTLNSLHTQSSESKACPSRGTLPAFALQTGHYPQPGGQGRLQIRLHYRTSDRRLPCNLMSSLLSW